jgi:uncharacterized protein (DUF2252 family)
MYHGQSINVHDGDAPNRYLNHDRGKMTDVTQRPDAAPHAVLHLTVEERVKLGKEARTRAPRSSHAEFSPATERPDPVSLLERQATSRVPELLPIRYGRMLVSPFTFFRGAALIMASDLATTPRSGFNAQVCGDAHLSNFGMFASPERKLMFDVNDFDETLPGPWEWDLKRLAASAVIAARDREFTDNEARTAALEVGRSYRREMARLAEMSTLEAWYSHIDVAGLLTELEATAAKTGSRADKQMAARTAQTVTKARTRDSLHALHKLTTVVDGRLRIVSDPPLVIPSEDLYSQEVSDALRDSFHKLVRGYRHSLQSDRRQLLEEFQFVQIARKVVGVGSVGTRAWILLMVGLDNEDPLFLQAKEAEASVLEQFVGKSGYASHGARVVAGQHLMQAASDIFLGHQSFEGPDGVTRDFYLRQLRDWKGASRSKDRSRRASPDTSRSAPRRWLAPTPARATASLSPAISGMDRHSIGLLRSSRTDMPIRTNATSRLSDMLPPSAGSRSSQICRGMRRFHRGRPLVMPPPPLRWPPQAWGRTDHDRASRRARSDGRDLGDGRASPRRPCGCPRR